MYLDVYFHIVIFLILTTCILIDGLQAVCFFETLVPTYWTTGRRNQEGHNMILCCSEKLKSYINYYFVLYLCEAWPVTWSEEQGHEYLYNLLIKRSYYILKVNGVKKFSNE
jgi:hypothetical protein